MLGICCRLNVSDSFVRVKKGGQMLLESRKVAKNTRLRLVISRAFLNSRDIPEWWPGRLSYIC